MPAVGLASGLRHVFAWRTAGCRGGSLGRSAGSRSVAV